MRLQEPFEDCFMPEPNSGCWLWLRTIAPEGYGQRWDGKQRRLRPAHVVSYELHKGAIPKRHELHHFIPGCKCVNPDHVLLLTTKAHRLLHRALQTHCKHGHEWTPENTYRMPSDNGKRRCKKCHCDRVRERARASRTYSKPRAEAA